MASVPIPRDSADNALERTFVLIKPNNVTLLNKIHDFLITSNFFVLDQKQVLVSVEMATQMCVQEYGDLLNGSQQKEYVAYLTSSNISVFVVERINAVNVLLACIGDVDPAKKTDFATMRQQFGVDLIHNAIYTPTIIGSAISQLEWFYSEPLPLERTLALLKPDALARGLVDSLLFEIERVGFTIVCRSKQVLSKEQSTEFYRNNTIMKADKIAHLSSGPVLAVVLTKPRAVSCLSQFVGPDDVKIAKSDQPYSLRARFGEIADDVSSSVCNLIHVSRTEMDAVSEIQFLFPQLPASTIPNEDIVREFLRTKGGGDTLSLGQVLVEGLTQLCKTKPRGLDAVHQLADWLLKHNPNQPFVEEPEEEDATTVCQRLSRANGGKRVEIVFLLSPPGLSKQKVCERLAHAFGFQLFYTKDIIQAAVDNTSEQGQMLKDRIASRTLVSREIVQSLIEKAMEESRSTKFLIEGFPRTLEQAISFEKEVGGVHVVLNFQGSETACLRGLLAIGDSLEEKDEDIYNARNQVKEWTDSLASVREHYTSFSKIFNVNAEQDPVIVFDQCKEILHGLRIE